MKKLFQYFVITFIAVFACCGHLFSQCTLVSNPLQVNVTCNGGANNGTASANVSGGTGPYTYLWSNAATTASISNLAPGTYSVTVTDASCNISGIELVNNGDFSAGFVGFSSSYTYQTNLQPEGTFYVATNPHTYHPGFSACGDHTNGTGNMMIVNGASGANVDVYCQTIAVSPNTVYDFSTWATSVNPGSPAILQFSINGQLLNTPFNLISTTCAWNQFYATWFSGSNTTAVICIVNQNTATSGNDFALDDISMQSCSPCVTTASVTITQPQALSIASAGTTNEFCHRADGTASVTAAGGTFPYTYHWSPSSQTTSTITGLATGNYSVTITDGNGCTHDTTLFVNFTQGPTTAITHVTNNLCQGLSSGIIVDTVNGGLPAYTYLWNNGQTSTTAVNLIAGVYTITVTDANGCTASASATITEPSLLVTTVTNVDSVICNGQNNGSISLNTNGGIPAYTYVWNTIPPQSSPIATNLLAGNYSVTVTDNAGCTNILSATVSQASQLTSSFSGVTEVNCFGLSNGSVTAIAAGGVPQYIYTWSNTASTAAINNLSAGTYTVTITDHNACSTIDSITITQPPLLNVLLTHVNSLQCHGMNNGSIIDTVTGGVLAYSYHWSNGQTSGSAVNLVAGVYTVTVTDANGCTVTTSATITQPTLLVSTVANVDSVVCYGQNNGSVSVNVNGGIPAYSYAWNTMPPQTTATASNLIAGVYTVTVTDSVGCTSTNTATVDQPAQFAATFSGLTQVTCYGLSNGSVAAVASGGISPYTFSWSNAADTAALANLIAGTYTVTITDMNACTATSSATITEPPLLIVSLTNADSVRCNGQSNGSITVGVTGGTPNYSYVWNTVPVQSTATASNIPAGTYTVTVTDNKGCTTTLSDVIYQPSPMVSSISNVVPVQCFGQHNGSLTANLSGGIAGYSYLWNSTPSQNTAIAGNLAAGTYTVTITDGNGCTNTVSSVVTQPNQLTLNLNSTNQSCVNYCNGQITSVVGGGVQPYVYTWSNTQSTSGISSLCPGTYSVTVEDANHCSTDDVATIINNTYITAGFTAAPDSGIIPLTVNFTFTGSGASNYSWNFGDGSISTDQNPEHVFTTAGTYNVVLIVNSGSPDNCSDTISLTIITEKPSLLTIPNVFTPNGDNINDEFMMQSQGIASFNCVIFNRWGKQIYDWTDVAKGWDGKTKSGETASAGTYYYIVSAKGFDKVPYEMHGSITLVR